MRLLPFVLGGLLTVLVFALFSFDLANHWTPYVPGQPDRDYLLRFLVLLQTSIALWREYQEQRQENPANRTYLFAWGAVITVSVLAMVILRVSLPWGGDRFMRPLTCVLLTYWLLVVPGVRFWRRRRNSHPVG